MAFTVPEQQVPHIKWLLELPDEKLEGFLGALSRLAPQFNVDDLAGEVCRQLQLPIGKVEGAIRVLVSLYVTREVTHEETEKFIDTDVHAALTRAEAFSSDQADVQWRKLRKFLISALSFERTLGTAAKAGNVLTQHERVFNGARVMTDLRPIFHIEVGEKPDAAVIIHMLNITQRGKIGQHTEFFFALDHNDLLLMRRIIDRALKKEETLRSAVKGSGITVLDPKLYF